MGLDSILLNGDIAMFEPAFGAATVAVRPDPIMGHGPAMVKGKLICVEGDEKTVVVPGCMYTAGGFSVPGVGIIMIQALAPDQKATQVTNKGKAILLKGGDFEAVFNVLSPAQMPPPVSTPDPMPKYMGKGKFISSNPTHKAT